MEPVAPVECPVCSSALKGEVALCVTCLTPHHRECWVFAGTCAVYGCGSNRFDAFALPGADESELLLAITRRIARSLLDREPDRAPRTAPRESEATYEVIRHKLGLFRSLNAYLEKTHPTAVQDPGDREVFDEVDRVFPGVDRIYTADDLNVAAPGESRLVHGKRDLLRRMVHDGPELPERGWWARWRARLGTLLRGR